jgi:hypothetical protein
MYLHQFLVLNECTVSRAKRKSVRKFRQEATETRERIVETASVELCGNCVDATRLVF